MTKETELKEEHIHKLTREQTISKVLEIIKGKVGLRYGDNYRSWSIDKIKEMK